MSGPGIAKTKAPCGCFGSEVFGYGACACFTCSECGFESITPLVTEDVKDGEHGPVAYRPCADCIAPKVARVQAA